MGGLDKYRDRKPRSTGCEVCGAPKVAEILVALRERTAGGSAKHLVSTSRGFCEEHAIATYEALIVQVKR
jgi:hypothetical protein